MEKLYELHNSTDFDLVVVDTPPSRNALDFLDAPKRLTRFLDHRLYRVLMAPTRGVMKAVNVAAQAFVRQVSKVVGAVGVRGRHHVLPGLRRHGGRVQGPGRAGARAADQPAPRPTCSWRRPKRDTVAEARFFADKLGEADIPIAALIVNRMHPHFTDEMPEALRERASHLRGHRPRRALPQPGRLLAGGAPRGGAPRRPGRRWSSRRR